MPTNFQLKRLKGTHSLLVTKLLRRRNPSLTYNYAQVEQVTLFKVTLVVKKNAAPEKIEDLEFNLRPELASSY